MDLDKLVPPKQQQLSQFYDLTALPLVKNVEVFLSTHIVIIPKQVATTSINIAGLRGCLVTCRYQKSSAAKVCFLPVCSSDKHIEIVNLKKRKLANWVFFKIKSYLEAV